MRTNARDGRAISETTMDGKFRLEWKFLKGRALRYKFTQWNHISGSWPAFDDTCTDLPDEDEVTLVMRFEILAVDARGVATVSIRFEHALHKKRFKGLEYDSEMGSPPPGSSIPGLEGKCVVATVSPRGEIISTPIQGLENTIGENQLIAVLQHCFCALPKDSLALEEKWESLPQSDQVVLGDITSRMRLEGITEGMKNVGRVEEMRSAGREAVIAMRSETSSRKIDDEFDMGRPDINAQMIWLVEQGIMASMSFMMDVQVAWLLHHVKHLMTRTTVKLIGIEDEAMLPPGESPTISADDLRRMLSGFKQLLDRVDPAPNVDGVGIADRIASGARRKKYSRPVEACMHLIRRMRNAIEHDGLEQLDEDESHAVRAAWTVVRNWAKGQGIDLDVRSTNRPDR